jgi:hypothetical protein
VTIANIAATIFLVGAFYFFQECVRAMRTGTVRADFGYEVSRGSVPGLYWQLVTMNALVAGAASWTAYWVLTTAAAA